MPLRTEREHRQFDSETADEHPDYVDTDEERLSACCGYGPIEETEMDEDRVGICAHCKENTVFLTQAEENSLYDQRAEDAKTQ